MKRSVGINALPASTERRLREVLREAKLRCLMRAVRRLSSMQECRRPLPELTPCAPNAAMSAFAKLLLEGAEARSSQNHRSGGRRAHRGQGSAAKLRSTPSKPSVQRYLVPMHSDYDSPAQPEWSRHRDNGCCALKIKSSPLKPIPRRAPQSSAAPHDFPEPRPVRIKTAAARRRTQVREPWRRTPAPRPQERRRVRTAMPATDC